MALNINKGSRFNLAKEAPALKVAGIGLGWDPNEEENGPDFDLDVSAFLITENGKIPADEYVVFFNSELKMDSPQGVRPYSGDGSVLGAVDSIDGTESDGEDVEVPDLIGLTLKEATELLETQGLNKTHVFDDEVSDTSEATIYKVRPSVGKKVSSGTSIDLFLK